MRAFKRCSLSLGPSLVNIMSWGDTETTVASIKWKSKYVQITILNKVHRSLCTSWSAWVPKIFRLDSKGWRFSWCRRTTLRHFPVTPTTTAVLSWAGMLLGCIPVVDLLVLLAWLYTWASFTLKLWWEREDDCIPSMLLLSAWSLAQSEGMEVTHECSQWWSFCPGSWGELPPAPQALGSSGWSHCMVGGC